ncbi:MAE_28990/MAE_18760 family HEPN-like nuclease [Actinomyces wuliandei]|uniref:MAE_28990/MAE_18760 family HEPN-like nuclease n=1 Tax=Actinomyces wuliandei TaxID=2057743 RepID=UPI000FD71D34|nr:MAE_28990/MAE_18760 family HEPN-like nuclease [Actinomyces wuliandei]
MATTELVRFFEERHDEIKEYVSFLQNLEKAAQGGAPRLRGTGAQITTTQTRILSSSLYLQLYNLVEATVVRCLEEVAAATEKAGCRPGDLSDELRTQWVRSVARTHINDLTPEKRLEAALDLCNHLLGQEPVKGFKIDPGGGGNWDDDSIRRLCERIGCKLVISPDVFQEAKRNIRHNMGALKLVKDRRNRLAHGSLSFVDCSDGVAVSELKKVADAVGGYLREAVDCFEAFIRCEISDRGDPAKKKKGVLIS